MKLFSKIFIIFFLLTIEVFGLNNCSYQEENKLSTFGDITKSVEDYSSTVQVTVPATEIPIAASTGGNCRNDLSTYSWTSNIYAPLAIIAGYHSDYGPAAYNNIKPFVDRFAISYATTFTNGRYIENTIERLSTSPTSTIVFTRKVGKNTTTWDFGVKYDDYDVNFYPAFDNGRCDRPGMWLRKGYTCDGGITVSATNNTCIVTQCPTGYSGSPCKKTINYTYKNYTCDANDKNPQGFGWELDSPLSNDGTRIDPDSNSVNSSTLDDTIYSHATQPNCKRKYQECNMECTLPATLETSTGKCILSYENDCITKGMTYSPTLNICEKQNQCNDNNAFKDEDSSFCEIPLNCNVLNGSCNELALKDCTNNQFNYVATSNLCEHSIGCNSNQVLHFDTGNCGSTPYCNNGDTQFIDKCLHIDNIQKSCSPDARDANLCYQSSPGDNQLGITLQKPLLKIDISGGYKTKEFNNLKSTFCTNDDMNCTFRLTDIYSANNGKSLCFKDAQGARGCIDINSSSDCSIDGAVHYADGIKQIFIENNGKTITAYNKFKKESGLGSLTSTCTLSGKVGHFDTDSFRSEIIAAKANGTDIEFWDSYRTGPIGIITFLPTIPTDDSSAGYVYSEPEIMQLMNKGFSSFYTKNNATYAVHNGLISKSDCQTKINGTSFYIAQATTTEEMSLLNMLSHYGNNKYNFNDGNINSGSCVIKSEVAKSFNEQDFSVKKTSLPNTLTKYVCSSLKCEDHTCQYNQCPSQFDGHLFNGDDLQLFINQYYQGLQQSDICLDNTCDSKLPYYPYCGSNNGCANIGSVYQQSDGSCVQASCPLGETFDPSANKCIKLDCKDSIKRGDKCYKSFIN